MSAAGRQGAEGKQAPDRRRSILAIHPGALGDVILFGHLLKALGGRVTLVAGGEKARLLADLGVVEEAVDFDCLPMHEAFADGTVSDRLRGRLGGFDMLISCLAAGDARAQDRLQAISGAAEAHFLPVRPPGDFPGHLVDFWTLILGISQPTKPPPPWPVPKSWCAAGGKMSLPHMGKYLVFHPGAGSPKKCWPAGRFVELAARMKSRAGLPTVSVLGPVEQERWGEGEIAAMGKAGELITGPSLQELAGLMVDAAAVLANDSGPAHLAAAVGAPTVVLFGPTDGRHFVPLGRMVQVLVAKDIDGISVGDVELALRRCANEPLSGGL